MFSFAEDEDRQANSTSEFGAFSFLDGTDQTVGANSSGKMLRNAIDTININQSVIQNLTFFKNS